MTETYEPPTTHVIPAKAGIYPRCVQTLEETALLRPSTEIDTIRQSPTNHNENSCLRVHARTRARGRGNGVPFSRHGFSGLDVSLGVAAPRYRANTPNGTSTRMACARHAGNTMVEGAMRLRSGWFLALTRSETREGRRAAADRSASGLPARILGFPKRRWPRRALLDLGFVLRPQAARTDVETARLSILVDGSLVHVRKPSGVGTPLRVADVVTGHTSLAANLTLCHNLFDRLSRIEYTCGAS